VTTGGVPAAVATSAVKEVVEPGQRGDETAEAVGAEVIGEGPEGPCGVRRPCTDTRRRGGVVGLVMGVSWSWVTHGGDEDEEDGDGKVVEGP
jgi:hypothetical protein